MNNENKQSLYLKATISIATIGISAVFYYLSRQGLLKNTTVAITRFLNVAWSICRHWSQLLKSLLSLSLSTSEQSIFEEEFKYLIVTSSLFNETPQQQQPQAQIDIKNVKLLHNDDIKDEEEFYSNSNRSLTVRVLCVSILNVIISVIISTKFNSVSPLLIPCLIPTWITTCYFLYRHHRHVQIRRIHASALDSMHKIISLSQEGDAILVRLLNNFHSYVGVQASAEHQQEFGTLLSNHFETYIEFVHQLQPLIDQRNLSRLRDMYNVNEEIPSLLLEFDSHQYKMDDIDLIYSVIGWKRREYLLYLLALDVMSNNRTNTHYGKNWRQAIKANTGLVKEYNQFNKKLLAITTLVDIPDKVEKKNDVISSQSSSSSFLPASPKEGSVSSATVSDKRSLTLMHRVSAVEKYIEDIQAKLFLCKQDTKSLSSGRVSTLSLERISKKFNHIDENIVNLLIQWEESKNALNVLLEDEQSKLNTITLLPSPPSSPRDFRQSIYEDNNSSGTFSNEAFSSRLSRSRSYSGGSSNSSNGIINSNRPLFSKNRLRRIQSLKTNNRIVIEPKSLTPINTTIAGAVSD